MTTPTKWLFAAADRQSGLLLPSLLRVPFRTVPPRTANSALSELFEAEDVVVVDPFSTISLTECARQAPLVRRVCFALAASLDDPVVTPRARTLTLRPVRPREEFEQWTVEYTVTDTNRRTYSLWLVFEFKAPLPDLKDWPVPPARQ